MQHKVEIQFEGRPLSIESGRVARQAHGSVWVQYGETVVLATVVAASQPRPGQDFFPLTVDYQEKTFAAGRIPGGFFKREGRQSEKEVLTSRLIDRPLRPLFPEGFLCETQVIATVLSADKVNDPDMLAMLAASAALHVSDIPFHGPIAGIRVARIDGKLVMSPTTEQMEQSELSLVVAGSADSLVMVEGGAQMLSEDVMLDALYSAHEAIQPLLRAQEELRKALGKPKRVVVDLVHDEKLRARVREFTAKKMRDALLSSTKQDRHLAVKQLKAEATAALVVEFPEREANIKEACEEVERETLRLLIVNESRRVDGRGLRDVRGITCETRVLPRTHGSAIFTRGETQALVVATLGTSSDEQRVDALIGETFKKFMLHYNFPPFSVGETKPLRGPGRREVGHGALAERSLAAVLPPQADFPYTIRIVSEILESNGSSSMASVCGGSLAMMDAGIPTRGAVAGIAMGLIKEGDKVSILSDILGDEDHLGDMDFKVAGTSDGITGLQMDIKIRGVTRDIMREALYQAREGRLHILGVMNASVATPSETLSLHAPRIHKMKIRTDKIRDLIGPGGKVIRGIVEETGVKIDVDDDGTVLVASSDGKAMQRAIEIIEGITVEAQVGKIYNGTVRKIVDFGAFVEIMPGTDGLLHISQIGPGRVQRVQDVLQEGDQIRVKVLEVDKSGKIRLSRREVLEEEGGGSSDGPRS